MKQFQNILSQNTSDMSKLLSNFFDRNVDLTQAALSQSSIGMAAKLSPKACVDLLLHLNIPMSKLRSIRRFFSNKSVSIFPSEPAIRNEMAKRLAGSSQIVTGKLLSEKSAVPFAKIETGTLEETLQKACSQLFKSGGLDLYGNFKGELWVKFGADKGENSTKLVFEIFNSSSPNSVKNTQLISFFEGPDTNENIRLFFGKFKSEFEALTEIELNGNHVPVRKFIFGDYHWLCDQFGHQGASSAFPCLFCHVTLEDLRRRSGEPHTPMKQSDNDYIVNEHCVYEARSIKSLQTHYLQNKADKRNDGKLLKNGKKHFSIVRDCLFPVELDHVSPIALHISLGWGHRFFQQLEDHCRNLDAQSEEIYEGIGPLVSALNLTLENDLNINKQAYHSSCFVGNHITKMPANAETLTSVLQKLRTGPTEVL